MDLVSALQDDRKVAERLASAGWHAQHDYDIEAWRDELEPFGFRATAEAGDIVNVLGGLIFWSGSGSFFRRYVKEPFGFGEHILDDSDQVDTLNEFSHGMGQEFCPIGRAGAAGFEGSQDHVVLGTDGMLYLIGEGNGVTWSARKVGDSVVEMLRILFQIDRRHRSTLDEVEYG